jgi:carboxymethylenebutenolidase
MKQVLIILFVVFLMLLSACISQDTAGEDNTSAAKGSVVQITSGGRQYPAYVAAPSGGGPYPGIVLVHSINGLEQGYRDMVDRFAGEGYVVIAPEWQTYARTPGDEVVEQLVRDTVTYLDARPDVDKDRLGLTGFCAGGRYTMLLMPKVGAFHSGVAWYGFPYNGADSNQTPASLIADLSAPMLIIHGTADRASPVNDIYRYATELDSAGKYFELKVYQGEPHGFMVRNGTLSESFVARDAFTEMVGFFDRTLA